MDAGSHTAGFPEKYDAFAMWQDTAVLCPKTSSPKTGWRVRTELNLLRISGMGSFCKIPVHCRCFG